jgi:MFS family permease
VTSLWQLFAVYFLMALGFSCTSLVPINTLITNWFFQKRGVAMGLTMIGLSLGGMVMVPFTVYIISHFSLQIALKSLGAILWLIVVPLAVFVVKRDPSVVGQLPDGKKPVHNALKTSDTRRGSQAIQTRTWGRKEAMKTSAFWFLVISYLLAMIGQNAYLVHQVSFLTQTLGAMKAASVVSMTTGASIIGRLFLGPLADRYEKRLVAMGCYLVQSVAILSLSYFRHAAVLYLGTFAFGLTMGGVVMMQSLLIGEYFGAASFGTIYGLAGSLSTIGWAIGPITAGLIFDATHDYRIAFNIFAVTSFAAMVTVFFAKPPASTGQVLSAK